MKGNIHSIETMGLSDGPGIRFVTFFQGCSLRCKYCHNPDTWKLHDGNEITAKELVNKAIRYSPYFKSSGGGITCSGGEPLLQPEFLIEYLKLCKENGLHTAIDTSGYGVGSYQEILKYTDLVILDIKHVEASGFTSLTGGDMKIFWDFVKELNQSNAKLWIRHVVVPGITDNMDKLYKLKEILMNFKRVENLQLLPYHNLGAHKYEDMGISYSCSNIEPMCADKVQAMEKKLEVLL